MIHRTAKPLPLATLVLLPAFVVSPSDALAATHCSADMTTLEFGTIAASDDNRTAGALDITCETLAGLPNGEAVVSICLDIGNGQSLSQGAQALRLRGESGVLPLQIAGDAAIGTARDSRGATHQLILRYRLDGNGAGHSGPRTLPVHARIPPQPTAPPGRYRLESSDQAVRLDYAYIDDRPAAAPPSCRGAEVSASETFALTVNAELASQCTIDSVSGLSFGTVASASTGNLDSTAGIGLTCTAGTTWQVGLDRGLNPRGKTRRMRNGNHYIEYELLRSAGGPEWGNTPGSDTVTGTGTGSQQILTVHGRIADTAIPAAGHYDDTVTITVTY